LDEIEQSLALDVTPASWPIGVGRDLLSTYDLFSDAVCSGANFCRSWCSQKVA
jgi:peptide subunit release factor RF-3